MLLKFMVLQNIKGKNKCLPVILKVNIYSKLLTTYVFLYLYTSETRNNNNNKIYMQEIYIYMQDIYTVPSNKEVLQCMFQNTYIQVCVRCRCLNITDLTHRNRRKPSSRHVLYGTRIPFTSRICAYFIKPV